MMHRLFLTIAALVIMLSSSAGAISFEEAVRNVDPQAKYLFYLHGAVLEQQGKDVPDKRYGIYKYDSIVEHFEDRGLTVIEEIRGRVKPPQYASKITQQIRTLIAKGVPSANITVSGFSKGGHMALLVASSLGDPDVGYVIMAGCGRGQTARSFEMFLKNKRGARLKGRILSIYATSDLDAGSCRRAIEQSSGDGLSFREITLKSGKGHGVFFQPRPEWIDPTAIFAKGGR